jgi:hypothetical protein
MIVVRGIGLFVGFCVLIAGSAGAQGEYPPLPEKAPGPYAGLDAPATSCPQNTVTILETKGVDV